MLFPDEGLIRVPGPIEKVIDDYESWAKSTLTDAGFPPEHRFHIGEAHAFVYGRGMVLWAAASVLSMAAILREAIEQGDTRQTAVRTFQMVMYGTIGIFHQRVAPDAEAGSAVRAYGAHFSESGGKKRAEKTRREYGAWSALLLGSGENFRTSPR